MSADRAHPGTGFAPAAFAYAAYLSWVWLADVLVLTTGCALTWAWLGSLVVVAHAAAPVRRRLPLLPVGLQAFDAVPLGLLLLLAFVTFPYPDRSYDSLNYHLLLQERAFADRLHGDVLPGGFTSYFFPLGDRAHYPFRWLLGYRAGRLLNLVALAASYLGLLRLLRPSCPEGRWRRVGLPIAALACLLTEAILSVFGRYYTDLLALPLLLEMARVVLPAREGRWSLLEVAWFAVLGGLVIALKVVNAWLVLVLAGALLWQWRRWRWRAVALAPALGVLPSAPYLFFNWTSTANPVFPFFNHIFRSPYAWISDVVPGAVLGPEKPVQALVWPLLLMKDVSRAIEAPYYSGRLGVGFLVAFGLAVVAVAGRWAGREKAREPGADPVLFLALVLLVGELVWSRFMQGYVRYGLFLEVLAGALCVAFLLAPASPAANPWPRRAAKGVVAAMLLASLAGAVNLSFLRSDTWLVANAATHRLGHFAKNLRQVLSDRAAVPDRPEQVAAVQLWGVFDHNCADAMSLRPDVPMLSMNEAAISEEMLRIVEARTAGRSVTTVVSGMRLTHVLKSLTNPFARERRDWVPDGPIRRVRTKFLPTWESLYVFEVRPAREGETTLVEYLGGARREFAVDVSAFAGAELSVRFQASLDDARGSGGLAVEVVADGERRRLGTVELSQVGEFRGFEAAGVKVTGPAKLAIALTAAPAGDGRTEVTVVGLELQRQVASDQD